MPSFSDLAHPWWLLGILAVAGIVAAYIWVARERRNRAITFANTTVLDSVAKPKRDRFKHVPIAILAVALLLLTVAMAGPQSMKKVPRNRATVILVIDVSKSMESTDVAPTRLAAAQEAAKKFAEELTPGINLGIVAYAGTAQLLVTPTPERALALAAIDHLELATKTATGEGIFAALGSIKQISDVLGGSEHAPPAHIVLESDGKETVPGNPNDPRGSYSAAAQAKEQGVPISTISFGTEHGTVTLEGQEIPVKVDDEALREIAKISGGDFFTASSLDELNKVYDSLQEDIGYDRERGDSSRNWLLLGTILAAGGVVAAIFVNRRLP